MKLLSLAQVDMSKTNACVVHPLDLAQGFRQNGISTQVIVISPRPALVKEKDLKVYVLPRWLIFPGVDNVAYNIMAWFILLFKSHSYDVIYVRQNFNLTIALWFIPWRNPVWLEVNGIFEDEEQFRLKNRGSRLKLWLGSFLERLAYQKADQVFCVTPQLKEKITGKNINPEKITVISNGVDIDKYYPMDKQSCKQKLGLDAAAIYIGFIGNISGWCGVDMLLRSLAGVMERYSQVRAIIGGDGEYLDEYIALAETLGLAKKVRFVGHIHKDIAPLWINAFDIGVAFTKQKGHGLSPLKLYSYMACGVPVVAHDISGFEIVRECKAGILVKLDDIDSAKAALERMISTAELRTVFSHNGRQCAEQYFSWKIIAKKIADR